ncbi:MAG: hypothetical protein ACD_73C00001G0003 [uncultured bacterium]|nr:MAG: hypothetical protein ACD_73C00001G0003 [uncultured bacterium]
MSLPLFLHLFSLGTWFGCVLVEGLLEFQSHKQPENLAFVARVHYLIDRVVEIPSFLLALLSGLWMLKTQNLQGLFLLKIICGLVAIGVNIYCVIPVRKRFTLISKNQNSLLINESKKIYWCFVGVPFGLAALILGILFLPR